MAAKSSFLDKVLGRLGRLNPEGLHSVVQRLASERSLLETLFNAIEDGVIVVDEDGRILYLNQAVTKLIGLKVSDAEGRSITEHLPDLDWDKLFRLDREGGQRVVRQEVEIAFPRKTTRRKSPSSWNNILEWTKGKPTAWTTSSRSFCRPSAHRRRN